jgi:short-subunit dehydrogenase
METKAFGIRVVVINPGDFATSNTANRTNIVVAGGPYEEQFRKTQAQFEKDEINGWDPLIMAKVLLKVVEKKRPCNRYVVASFEQKLAIFLKRILPIGLFFWILGDHYKIK